MALPFYVVGIFFGLFFSKTYASKYGAQAGSGLSIAIFSHIMRGLNISGPHNILALIDEVAGLILVVIASFGYWFFRRRAITKSEMAANVA